MYEEFKTISPDVKTTHVDKLDTGRSDVAITTEKCTLVLKFKKNDTATGPTAYEWNAYHAQIRKNVAEHKSRNDPSK